MNLKNKSIIGLGLFLLGSIALLCSNWIITGQSEEEIVRQLQEEIQFGAEKLSSLVDHATDEVNPEDEDAFESYFELFQKEEGYDLFVYENDSLLFWTSGEIDPNFLPIEIDDKKLIHLSNGYYISTKIGFRNKVFVGLFLVKKDYPFENQYLINELPNSFQINHQINILENGSEVGYDLKSGKGDLWGKIEVELQQDDTRVAWSIFLLSIGIFAFLQACSFALKGIKKRKKKYLFLGVSSCFIVLIRLVMQKIKLPTSLYHLELFDPSVFANSFWFPSLGDFLVNAIFLLYLLRLWYQLLEESEVIIKPIYFRKGISITLLLSIFTLGNLFNQTFIFLIQDSSIFFNIGELFKINIYTIIGLLLIGILLLILLMWSVTVVKLLLKWQISMKEMQQSFLLSIFLYVLGVVLFSEIDLIIVLWPILFAWGVCYRIYKRGNTFGFSGTVLMLVIVASFASAHIVFNESIKKEHTNRLNYARNLMSDEDPLLELEFEEIEMDLAKNAKLQQVLLKSEAIETLELEQEIKETYFSNYWDKYDLSTIFFNRDSVQVGNNHSQGKSFGALDELISFKSVKTSFANNMYYIPEQIGNTIYIIKLPVLFKNKLAGYFFLEVKSKLAADKIGFPRLLMRNQSNLSDKLSDYSYVRYREGQILISAGNVKYPASPKRFQEYLNEKKQMFHVEGEMEHLIYHEKASETVVVLSKNQIGVLDKITIFSYLFALNSLLFMLAFAVRSFPKKVGAFYFNLQSKVQLLMVGLVLISLVLFVLGTRYYIENQYKETHQQQLSDKINSVLIEVKQKLGSYKELTEENSNYMNYIMNKFFKVFAADIHLYDLNAELLATSRWKVFDAKLQSPKMDPQAYLQLSKDLTSEYIHEERIGKLNYLSAYVPLVNFENKTIGYLNLAYFLKQNDFEREITNFLVAVINISVLLFALSILAALFVSSWITQPLRLLQNSLSSIELGKSNEPIEYKGNDEISSLVKEYNNKVVEIEKKAEQLAKSEREFAWREMAKQVAHEIKNPLTPMKLRIQHLQRSFDPSDPNVEEKIEKLAKSLIEQIDGLTIIANEFSNFAKMPPANKEEFNLVKLLSEAVEIHKQREDVRIQTIFSSEEIWVRTDKKQFVRVINNLITNAVQAIPKNRLGEIDVKLIQQDQNALLEVKDNGIGIDDDKTDKIFVPNFTTKSTGMGLGLAMVKNIVENSGGKIWFETTVGEGTSFYVSLPVIPG